MKKATIIAAIIGGVCILLAAVIQTYRWSSKPQPNDVVIAGMVIDQRTSLGIGQASIYVVGHPEQFLTEDNGNFRFDLIVDKSTIIRLHVTKSGYRTLDRTVHVPAESLTLPLQMQ
jgi:hypothetical protein